MRATKRRWIKRAVLSALVLAVAGVGLAVYLLQRPPVFYREAREVLRETSAQSRERMTRDLMTRLADLTAAAPNIEQAPLSPSAGPARIDVFGSIGGPGAGRSAAPAVLHAGTEEPIDRFVEMQLSNQELVAFVNEMFVEWSIQRGYIIPGGVNDPVVMARDGELVLAFDIDTPYWKQVFSGKLDIAFGEDGMAVGKVTELKAGSLPMTMMTMRDVLEAQVPESHHDMIERMVRWLNKLDRFEFRPVIELENSRRARVYAMAVRDAGVRFKLRVQDRHTYKAHNALLADGRLSVTDRFEVEDGSAFADVPTVSD